MLKNTVFVNDLLLSSCVYQLITPGTGSVVLFLSKVPTEEDLDCNPRACRFAQTVYWQGVLLVNKNNKRLLKTVSKPSEGCPRYQMRRVT